MKIHVTLALSEQSRTLELSGRLGWTMAQLVEAGQHGIRTTNSPALRLSAYIHSLSELRVPIETVMENHDGPYPGQHARYALTCDAQVRVLEGGYPKMTQIRHPAPPTAVLRIMRKHGLPEPAARLIALHAYGETALHG